MMKANLACLGIANFGRSVVAAGVLLAAGGAYAAEVNVYTTREPGLLKPLLEAFTAKTSIKVNTVFVKDGLGERVAAEGAKSPADLLMAVDVGNLLDLVDKGVTQPLKSTVLEQAIPAHLRDAGGQWFALSLRARVVYAAKSLPAGTPVSYEELADPKYKGKVCMRSGQHPYNTALIAAHIARHGAEKTESWLNGVKANLARKPGGGDREVARDILGGLCEVGLGNSYYVGLMRSGKGGPDQKAWGDAINVALPVFAKGGTHVNASGAALAKHAPHPAEAAKLMEFLVSAEGQAIYANANYEYPVLSGVTPDPVIAALGKISPDSIPLAAIVAHRKQASELVDKVGFDR